MSETIDIRVDTEEVTKALDQLDPKSTKKVIQSATRAAGKFLKPKLKAAAPKGKTGNMRKKVGARTKKSKRDPGSYYTVVTTFSRHRHLVIEGTKDRYTKGTHAFRGRMTPNPWIDPVEDQYGDAAVDLAKRELIRKLNLE